MRLEKKDWISPRTGFQEFVPQQYCGSCEHDSGGSLYHFQCNAGIKEGYSQGYIYEESNGVSGLQSSSGSGYPADSKRDYFHPNPNVDHWAPTTDEFKYGYFVPFTFSGVLFPSIVYHWNQAFPVIIWDGDGDLHATSELDISKWEKNFS